MCLCVGRVEGVVYINAGAFEGQKRESVGETPAMGAGNWLQDL